MHTHAQTHTHAYKHTDTRIKKGLKGNLKRKGKVSRLFFLFGGLELLN